MHISANDNIKCLDLALVLSPYFQPLSDEIHLTPSITFPNLQQPAQNGRLLKQLESDYQGVFQWSGEINVFKHALGTCQLSSYHHKKLKLIPLGY